MNITAGVGQYDSGSAAALCVHVGEAQVELFEPAGHPKHGRCGFKQQHTGDELGTPKDRGLMSGAVGIDQESAIPIAGRCSFVAMHRLSGLLGRSEQHTSELQSLMRISYAVFCLKKKIKNNMIKHTKAPIKSN